MLSVISKEGGGTPGSIHLTWAEEIFWVSSRRPRPQSSAETLEESLARRFSKGAGRLEARAGTFLPNLLVYIFCDFDGITLVPSDFALHYGDTNA